MKYYAVTDDPRELYHYGVKGMKWGQHIFGDKPKSPGYHRALGKLKSTVKTAAKRSAVNRRTKEERKYEKAVQRTQNRIKTIENLYKVDQEKAAYDQAGREYRKAQKTYKMQNRQAKQYAKNEAKMDKIMEKARRGKLKYGKLSQDQIERIQDRLNLENQTRRLGSQEKTWHQQKKEARRQGKLLGIQKGTAAAMEEVARGATQFGIQGIRNNLILKNQAKQEGKREKAKTAAKNKKTRKDFERELHEEVMRAEVRDADAYDNRRVKQLLFGKSQSQIDAEKLKQIENRKRESEFNRKLDDERNENYRKMLVEIGGSDEENRKAYASTLSAQDQARFANMSKQDQQQEVLKFHNNAKKLNEAAKEAAEKMNDRNAYMRIVAADRDRERFNFELKEFSKDMETFRKDHAAWEKSGGKGKEPQKPQPPRPPIVISYDDLIRSGRIPKHGNSGGGGGKK